MRGSWKIGRIAGIEIGIHYTWLLALFLFTWLLEQGVFPVTLPGQTSTTYWVAGFISTVLLFISVLIHELAHSLVAKAKGLPVSSITIFILGGVSNLTEEPEKPGVEFQMAAVGPGMSLVLAILFWLIGIAIGINPDPLKLNGPQHNLAQALIAYLAYANALLAAFNILPGFPLDGGRVFRSIIWSSTGDLVKATNIAATVGRIFGWGFILLGIAAIFFLQGGLVSGIWLAVIGWFLNSAADTSRTDATLREHLTGVSVNQVMDKQVETISPNTPISELVQNMFMQKRKRAISVVDGERLVGIVTISDVKHVSQDRWPSTPVSQIMHREPIHTVKPEDDLNAAWRLIAQYDLNQVPVLSQDKLVGCLTRADIVNYLHVSQELKLKSGKKVGSAT
jgi:Zn-dependent protease/CBS domain-containing protein